MTTPAPVHRLDYERSGAGLLASCQCGDFHAYIEGTDLAAELALLSIHQVHIDHPELGSIR